MSRRAAAPALALAGLLLAACGVKAPPRPPTGPGAPAQPAPTSRPQDTK